MIRCDRLPSDNKLVFSDDRALLPADFNDHIQAWLSEGNPRPHLALYDFPRSTIGNYTGDAPDIAAAPLTATTVYFQPQLWQIDDMRRVWLAAICLEKDWQILGPEIDPSTGGVIAPSPVVDVIVRKEDQPPASMQETALRASEVWAGLTDAERERHPRIGEVAAMADLDALL